MGQLNLVRTEFVPRVTVVAPANDDLQPVNFTGYFQVGDTVDVIDEDANGNVTSVLADNLTILAIDPGVSLTLSAVVDTTLAVGTPKIVCQNIDDGQEAMDRLYRKTFSAGNVEFLLRQDILAQALNSPIGGQTLYDVEDVSFIRVGDVFDILADEGLVQAGVVIAAVSPNSDDTNNKATVAITTVVDTSTFTNPFLLARNITVQKAIARNQERIDEIDRPVENEDLGLGDNRTCAFETSSLFVQGSSKVFLDGVRKKLGTAGTRASLTQGAGNSQLIYTSLIPGLKGNDIKVRVQAGAGLTVSVTGSFNAGPTVTINNNGGAATSAQIAAALLADATAKRLIQVQYGGNGSGVVAAFGPTNLAGGLDNGTGDYAEVEQVFENLIVDTGYKWIIFHVRPNENNRMNKPPEDDEEVTLDYRRPSENVNR